VLSRSLARIAAQCKQGTVEVVHHGRAMGYSIEEAHPKILARVEAILISDGWLQGANDSRSSDRLGGDGKAAGY
jgi:hypothetical protein